MKNNKEISRRDLEENISKAIDVMQILASLNNNPYYKLVYEQNLKDYELYKSGQLEITDNKELEMQIYLLLEELGFPLEYVGTFFYKEMIFNASRMLNGEAINRGEIYTEKEVKEQMLKPYSQFYIDIASNDLEVGVTSFHRFIGEAITNVDVDKCNKLLLKKIFEKHSDAISYQEQAYYLSEYVKSKYLSQKQYFQLQKKQ